MASQLICKGCGQPILGRYITALGASWHPEHFVCAACRQPISETSFNIHEGAAYHAKCYLNRVASRCAYCGKPLTGQYYEHQGKQYHPECYREHIVSRCAYCGKPLLDQYLVDYWGTHYCKEHESNYPHCAYCGRLVPPQSQERDVRLNPVVRCPICRSSAIESSSQAQPIFRRLVQEMNKQGLQYNHHQLNLELVDRATLTERLKARSTKDTLGVTSHSTHSMNGLVVRIEVNGIAVLQGLPSTLFQGVTVHELGHAWLAIQGIQGLPPWAEEGFCELLAYRFYKEMNTPESRYHAESIERNKDQIYGEGFKRVRALSDAMGFRQLVETMRTTRRIPSQHAL
ncbi:MAG: hypothetical protein NVS4B7_17640 [Ktedonobacteraceae bacterium]